MPANRHGRFHNQNHGRNHNQQANIKPVPSPHKQNTASLPPPPHEIVVKEEREKPQAVIAIEAEGDGADAKAPPTEKKFTQRSRLFVGNIPTDMTEQQFKDLFAKYGEISEIFVNSGKGFGFVRLDTRANAEKAKWELDGHQIKNRQLRVRFASHGAALSLKHLSPFVSNELLETAFSQFGTVERAVVIVDDRGRSTGRGIVEFARKSSATKALQQIADGCFLLTSSPQAVVVKPLEQEDTEDGLNEKNIPRSQQYFQEREAPPRFAQPGTFEYEFALRWKALDEMERDQQEQLTKSIAAAREKLELEMESAIHEHKTMLMKQDLMRRQEELKRLEDARLREVERRKQLEFAREEAHRKEIEDLAKRQEILRAQVEGTYQPLPNRHLEDQAYGGMQQSHRQGGYSSMQDVIAQEMMAGGQGGLGPAPMQSGRQCSLTPTSMKKILGNKDHVRKNPRFYRLALDHAVKKCHDVDSSTNGERKDNLSGFYSRLSTSNQPQTCQSFSQWKFQMIACKINRMFAQKTWKLKNIILYFLPIGPFPDFVHEFRDGHSNRPLNQLLCEFLSSYFCGTEMRLLPECDVDDIAPTSRLHDLTGKKQYYVSDFLTYLQRKLPKDGFAIVGLTWHDLYPCEKLNFILGQGSFQHSACIASFGRFDPNLVRGFKGRKDGILPEEMKDITEINDALLWKLFKILSHETAHVFGVLHCTVFQCLMNESSSTNEALSQPLYLCPFCMSKIQHLKQTTCTNVGTEELSIEAHFSSIREFLQTVFTSDGDVTNEKAFETIHWLDRMLSYLRQ